MFLPPPSSSSSSTCSSMGVGVFPLLGGGGVAPLTVEEWGSIIKRRQSCDESSIVGGGVCEDCGNRAKKECSYRRCRTCCRSRGFQCSTHVKSTWVPASVRRDKILNNSASGAAVVKKTKLLLNSNSNCAAAAAVPASSSFNSASNCAATSTKSFPTTTFYRQDASFREQLPRKVSAPANFKSVRVIALNDGDAEIVYQATVNISGHVFKGFLYNHGVDEKNAYPRLSDLHLYNTATGQNRDSSSPIVNPSNAFVSGD